MDDVFRALADPGRRALLDALHARDGQTLRELCGVLDMTRQSVSKHLAVLEEAGVVVTQRRGREKLHHLNAAPLNAVADRWISKYDRERARVLDDLVTTLEEPVAMDEFVYVTHVRTTPEKLWQALTDPEFTRRYWGVELATDWEPGSTMAWSEFGATTSDPEQKVLLYEPYERLSYTWHTFSPQWAQSSGIGEEWAAKARLEPRSTVTFQLDPVGENVKLTVVHGGFGSESIVLQGISQGWPALLSSLKTLLETGSPL